jgi:hypothetical protein
MPSHTKVGKSRLGYAECLRFYDRDIELEWNTWKQLHDLKAAVLDFSTFLFLLF